MLKRLLVLFAVLLFQVQVAFPDGLMPGERATKRATLSSIFAPPLEQTSPAGAYTLTRSDAGTVVSFVGSSSATFAFAPAASLGKDWSVYLQNAGSSNATVLLDPSGAEQIDGRTSYKMYPGEVRLLHSTGTSLNSIVLHGFYMVYTATVTGEPVPPGYKGLNLDMWGGGAGGANGAFNASGGGGGGHWGSFLPASVLGATFDANIGPGGAANSAGTDSTFVSNSITYSAKAGATGAAAGTGSAVNGGKGGDGLFVGGQVGTAAPTFAGDAGGTSGNITAGNAISPSGSAGAGAGAGGGRNGVGASGTPGTSVLAGPGGAANAVGGTGSAGSIPGGGGGAGATAGAGARGEVRVSGII